MEWMWAAQGSWHEVSFLRLPGECRPSNQEAGDGLLEVQGHKVDKYGDVLTNF